MAAAEQTPETLGAGGSGDGGGGTGEEGGLMDRIMMTTAAAAEGQTVCRVRTVIVFRNIQQTAMLVYMIRRGGWVGGFRGGGALEEFYPHPLHSLNTGCFGRGLPGAVSLGVLLSTAHVYGE